MSFAELIKEYNALPRNYQREVEDFISFLKAKMTHQKNKKKSVNVRTPGTGKDMVIWIAPDFDAPLDDLREYME